MEAIGTSSISFNPIDLRSMKCNAQIPTSCAPFRILHIRALDIRSRMAFCQRWSTTLGKSRSNASSEFIPHAEARSAVAAPTSLRLPFQLSDGQFRFFHSLPSGMRMEVIVQKAAKDGLNENQPKKSPIVFVHGSFHAAWCWAVHWLPFFANCGHDCYAVSLLGQTHARDIAHFIRQEVGVPPILAGHSFGGLIVQLYLSNVSTNLEIAVMNDEGWEEPYPNLAAAVLLCSVPPTGNGGLVWRYLLSKPIAALKVTLSLAAKAFTTSLSLCRETFFSQDMPELQVERYKDALEHQ